SSDLRATGRGPGTPTATTARTTWGTHNACRRRPGSGSRARCGGAGRRRSGRSRRHQLREHHDVVAVVANGAVELAAAGDELQGGLAGLGHHPVPGELGLRVLLDGGDPVAELLPVGLVDEDLVAGRELLQPGEDAGLALLPVREKAVDVADDDSGPGLAGLPLVAVLELLLPRVPAGLLGGEHRGDFEAVAVGAVLRLAGEAERDQRGADVQLRQVDGCGVRLLGVDHRDGAGRRGRLIQRVGVVLGAAPREKERGTEHNGGQPHAGPTPVCTPPCGTATSSLLTTSSSSSKSLELSGAVSWPGSQAMRSSSASRPCGSPGNWFRMSCAVRPSAKGKSLQSRSTNASDAGSSGA